MKRKPQVAISFLITDSGEAVFELQGTNNITVSIEREQCCNIRNINTCRMHECSELAQGLACYLVGVD